MNMEEFYAKYNLNKYNFASIAGVGTSSLIKFANGESLRESTKTRIETAMRIAENYNLVRPRYDYGKALFSGMWYKNEFHSKVRGYEKLFKELIEKEEF